jgi:hypothetical protein
LTVLGKASEGKGEGVVVQVDLVCVPGSGFIALEAGRTPVGVMRLRRRGESCPARGSNLSQSIRDAKLAMRGDTGDRALRQRAEAVRAVIQRIECTFTATGVTGSGWGKRNAQLAKVTIYPVGGDSVAFSADSKGTLWYSSAQTLTRNNVLQLLLRVCYRVA